MGRVRLIVRCANPGRRQRKPGAVPVVGVLDVKGGKVKAWREYYDRAQLLKELGAAEH